MHRMVWILLVSVLITCFSGHRSWAQDGRTFFTTRFCITCHGKNGRAIMPIYPNLTGQNSPYMIAQVKHILGGRRKSDLTVLMTNNPIVMGVTDKELEAITTYLSNLK